MGASVIQVAEEGLRTWLLGVANNHWTAYQSKLTPDYKGWATSICDYPNFSENQKRFLPNFIERLGKITTQHIVRVTVNQQTVVFELEDPQQQICVALSFDVLGEKIAACREYYSYEKSAV